MKYLFGLTITALAVHTLIPFSLYAASDPVYKSNYVGQEKREIKSLSSEDISELKAGAGWGLAKAAELNGLPGPKHILEMKQKIELTPEQEKKVTGVYKKMHAKALDLGNRLIELEMELNNRFADRRIDERTLAELLNNISETYSQLRFVHLAAHLKTPNILTEHQIKKYNTLRGYFADDPCTNIPEGHDPKMWRKHNNCD
jgi:hypothetical protein